MCGLQTLNPHAVLSTCSPRLSPGIIGLPLTVAGGIYVVCLGRWLLPRRDTLMASVTSDPREYVVSVKVDARYAHLGG